MTSTRRTFKNSPSWCQKQTQRHIRGGVAHHARRVGHLHSDAVDVWHVQVVDAHPSVDDHLQRGKRAEQRGLDQRKCVPQKHGLDFRPVQQGVLKQVLVGDDLEVSPQNVSDIFGETFVAHLWDQSPRLVVLHYLEGWCTEVKPPVDKHSNIFLSFISLLRFTVGLLD